MASKTKKGTTITDSSGVEWRKTDGGHWRDDKTGKLFNNGGSGDPTAGPSSSTPGVDTYQNALNSIAGDNAGQLKQGLSDLSNGDEKIAKGFQGGAEIGSSLFAPGSLGRVSETASQDQTDINKTLKDRAGPNVDPLLQPSLDRAEKTANDAQTLNPELQNVLNLRKSALGGLSSDQLLAEKESAQAGYNQSLTSAARALRVTQGGSGPRGAASGIAAIPLTAQYANSQAELQRKLVLDDYKSKQDALNSYSSDAQSITSQQDANRINANTAAQGAETGALNNRTDRFNNYVSYNTAVRNDLYGRQLQNLNTIAAEKSGQAASIFGGGSFASQQEGQQQTFELGKENLDLQKKIFGSQQSSGGSSDSGTTSPGSGNSDVFG